MIHIPPQKENNLIHVFPSEVVASFWRFRFLRSGERKALREDRVISWDVFKEVAFDLSKEEKPVNSRLRLLFTEGLGRTNKTNPFLSYLIPREYAEDSEIFLSLLVSLLPRLGPFMENRIDELEGTRIPEELKKDLRLLYHEYYNFLHRHGFYEPAWIVPEVKESNTEYIIHFPEVIEDYELFRNIIQNSKHLHPHSIEPMPPKEVYQFSSSWEEAEWICHQIRESHQRGTSFHEMAITAPDPAFTELLIKTGELYSLPFVPRQGTNLLEYPGARFFSVLSEIGGPPISLESAKKLLLDFSIPWKNQTAWKDLIRFGITHHCIIGYGDPLEDPWLRALKKTGNRELEQGYSRLGRAIIRITKAKRFSEVKKGIIRFSNEYFNNDDWEPEALAPFQRCLDLLNRFIETEEMVHDLSPASPFSLFTRLLSEQLYVPQGRAGGIDLFPYRVSAGIDPPLHFIAGIDQKNTEVSRSPYPFLKEDMIIPSLKEPHPAEERHYTEAFLSLYTLSGNRVVYSGSAISLQGPQIFPASLLPHVSHDPPGVAPHRRDSTAHTHGKNSKDFLKEPLLNPLEEEQNLWEEKEKKPFIPQGREIPAFSITPLQRRGLLAALGTVFQKKEADFTEKPITSSGLRNRVRESFTDEQDQFLLSPSSMESLVNCPFSYLFQRVFHCEAPEYEVTMSDPKWEGVLLHEILRRIFQGYLEKDLPFPDEENLDYSLGENSVKNIMKEAEEKGMTYLHPAWNALFHSTTTHIKEFLKKEANIFSGYRVHALEKEYRRILDDSERILLRGRIDRISYGDEGFIIVDYKRNSGPTKSDLAPEEGEPRSFQLPFYGFLLEKETFPIEGIMVYAFKKAKYQKIFGTTGRGGKALLSLEEYERLVTLIPEKAKEIVYKIIEGDFTIPKEEPDCRYCRSRSICRAKYTVRNRD